METTTRQTLRAVSEALEPTLRERPSPVPAVQRVAAQQLAVSAAYDEQRAAADRLGKLGESLQAHWKDVCDSAITSAGRTQSIMTEAESTFKSALIVLERAQALIRDEGERINRVVLEGREKAKRVIERCETIERDITGVVSEEATAKGT
jgi:hypothetical protein